MNKILAYNKRYGISSFAVALFASVPTLNMIITRILPGTEGIMMASLYAISLFLVFLSLFFQKRKFAGFSLSFVLILSTIGISFILSQNPQIPSLVDPITFLMFTIVPLCIPQIVGIDAVKTVKLLMILPSFGIFFVHKIFSLTLFGTIEMDLTYSFLTPIIATFVYLSLIFKESKRKERLFLLLLGGINIVYFLFCILFGSRAAGLSILLCIVFLACTKVGYNGKGFKIKPLFWYFLLSIVLIVLFFDTILYGAVDLLKNLGFESMQLEKMVKLYELGDLSDGRSDINALAVDGILKSPLYGHGLSASQPFTNYAYPHNFILQLLLDGGVVLFLIIMVPMIIHLLKLKAKGTKDEYLLLITLFFASVPGALFSLDIWENSRFWLFMGFLLSKVFRKDCITKSIYA